MPGTYGTVGIGGRGSLGGSQANLLLMISVGIAGVSAAHSQIGSFLQKAGRTKSAELAWLSMSRAIESAAQRLFAFGIISAGFLLKSAAMTARVQELDTVLKAVASTIGYTGTQVDAFVSEMIEYGISTTAARQSLLQFVQANMKLEDAAKLARVAQNLAVIAGTDSSTAFQRLTLAIAKANVRMLHTFGIMVTNRQAWSEYAKTIGKSTATLTVHEKRLAVMEAVFREQAHMQDTYNVAMTTTAKQMRTLTRYFHDFQVDIGHAFLPVFDVLIGKVTQLALGWRELSAEQKLAKSNTIAMIAIISTSVGAIVLFTMKMIKLITAVKNFRAALLAIQAGGGVFAGLATAMGPLLIILTTLGVLISITISQWIKYTQQVYRAKEGIKTAAQEMITHENVLKNLKEQLAAGTISTYEFVKGEAEAQKELEESNKVMKEQIRLLIQLNIIKRIQTFPDPVGMGKELEIIQMTYEEAIKLQNEIVAMAGPMLNVVMLQDLLNSKIIDANVRTQLQIALQWKLYELKMKEWQIAIKAKQIEEDMNLITDVRVVYIKDLYELKVKIAKLEDGIADRSEENVELAGKLKGATEGELKVVVSKEKAQTKLAKLEARVHLKRSQVITTQASLEKKKDTARAAAVQKLLGQQKQLINLEQEYNSWYGKREGVYVTTFGTEVEIAALQSEVTKNMAEQVLKETQLVELYEKQRIFTKLMGSDMYDVVTAQEKVTEGVTTLAEYAEFHIETNIFETKMELENFKNFWDEVKDTVTKDTIIKVDSSGAITNLEEVVTTFEKLYTTAEKYGLEEWVIQIYVQEALERLDKVNKSLEDASGNLEALKTMADKFPKGKKFWAMEIKEEEKRLGEFAKTAKTLTELTFTSNVEQIMIDARKSVTESADAKAITAPHAIPFVEKGIPEMHENLNRFVNVWTGNVFTIPFKAVIINRAEIASEVSALRALTGGTSPVRRGGIEEHEIRFQHGGIFTKPAVGIFGEAGAEALIPLTRKSIHPVIQEMQEALGLFQQGAIFGLRNKLASKSKESHYISSPIVIENLIIREEADIIKVAQELERLRKLSTRAGGMR